MDYIYIDTEYTSFYNDDRPKCGDLLQVGLKQTSNGLSQESFCENSKNIGKVWSEHAEAVHGITKKKAEGFQHPREMANNICDYLARSGKIYTGVGHYCSGDKKYLLRLMQDYELLDVWNKHIRPEWIDTHTIYKENKRLIPSKNGKLSTLCEFFKIEGSANWHDALADASATRHLHENLIELIAPKNKQGDIFQETALDKRLRIMSDSSLVTVILDNVRISPKACKDKTTMNIILKELYELYVKD